MRVLVLHGPNLNLLGEREPVIYGRATLEEIDARIGERAAQLGAEVRCFQSNHEGTLVDRLHAERRWASGLLFNPAAYTHYAWSLRDAVAAVALPCVEVHLSDVTQREPWRRVSVLADVRVALCAGRGIDSYLEGLELLVEIAPGPELDSERMATDLGKRLATPAPRAALAKDLAEAVRRAGRFRWVGLYDVGDREVVVQDVHADARHLPTLEGTRAEAIFPVLDAAGAVVGTLDVESANAQAFTPARVSWLAACARALVPFWGRSRD